jgi:hypothetical protein
LVSAGVGATPVLAILDSLVAEGSDRDVWWLHGARCGEEATGTPCPPSRVETLDDRPAVTTDE